MLMRAAALEPAYSSADHGLAPEVVGHGVERLDTLHLVDRTDLQVVLQIGADTGQLVRDGNAVLLQGPAHPDRCPRAAGSASSRCCPREHHFARGAGGDHLLAGPDLHARALLAAVGRGLDDQARDLGRGPELEVGAAVAGRTQEGLGRVPAPAAFLVHLEVAHAFVVAAVEVVVGGNARLYRGLGKGIEHVPAQALLLDAPFAAGLVVPHQGAVVIGRLLEMSSSSVGTPFAPCSASAPLW